MDVSLGTRGSVVTFLPQEVLLVDTTNSLHQCFVHKLDVDPIRLTLIAHAFNYRGFAGWSEIGGASQPFPEGGWADFGGYWSPVGTSGCLHVSNCVCPSFGSAISSAGSQELAWSVA